MRLTPALLALPALAAAQQGQTPLLDALKGLYNKASAALGSAPSAAAAAAAGAGAGAASSAIPSAALDPLAAAASAAASLAVESLTVANYKQVLQPSAGDAPGTTEWMIFVTGGNKTCFGLCERAETAWNESLPLLAASSKPAPHLATLDCETDGVVCNAWAVGPPTVVYALMPAAAADQSAPHATPVYYVGLNRTTVTASQVAALHTEAKYAEKGVYEGYFHPFDGKLAQFGLDVPFGYAVYYFSLVPSWAMMIGISFFSRTFMGRRSGGGRPAAAAGAPPAAAGATR